MARVDYEQIASVYDAGRDQPSSHRENWRAVLEPFIDRDHPLLDLGAGTGQWSMLFAEWFDVEIVAVEPSAGMRAAAAARDQPRVRALAGSAQHIPLADGSVGTVWLSAVWHHIADPDRAATELHRVLRPGGSVCLRGVFPDAGPAQDITLLRAFPEATGVLATFPTIAEVTTQMRGAGLEHRLTQGVTEIGSTSAKNAYRRAARRADTLLRLLPDEIYMRRLSELAQIADTEVTDLPWTARLTLLIFSKP